MPGVGKTELWHESEPLDPEVALGIYAGELTIDTILGRRQMER